MCEKYLTVLKATFMPLNVNKEEDKEEEEHDYPSMITCFWPNIIIAKCLNIGTQHTVHICIYTYMCIHIYV